MTDWPEISAEEIERRRLLSVKALEAKSREEFAIWYQEQCDRDYWTCGQCCAGCDHWQSEGGNAGTCAAAGIVSGADVIRSIGASFCSYTPPPGLPYTRGSFHCGNFRDSFDWSTLDREYLTRIGAMRHGQLKPKPISVRNNERLA